MAEFSEKWLAAIAGWPVVHEARKLLGGGRVVRASFAPPLLSGVVREGNRTYATGLRILSGSEVENICQCRTARTEGKVCPHAVAAALFVLAGSTAGEGTKGTTAATKPRPGGATPAGEVCVTLEGSLQGVEAEIQAENETLRAQARKILEREGFVARAGRLTLTGREAVLRFLAEGARELPVTWRLESGPRFHPFREALVPVELRGTLTADGADGWFRLHCELAAGGQRLPWEEVRRAAAAGRATVALPDGRLALVNRRTWGDFEETLSGAGVRSEGGAQWRVPVGQAEFVRESLAAWQGETAPPASRKVIPLGALEAILRPYQKDGVFWMADRAASLGGAILADDMGLGKTLQALALMRHLGGPCLVVCPASLVFNWAAEAAQFWPSAQVVRWAGAARRGRSEALARADLVITNYALLRTDLEVISAIPWTAVVLDEAQHIKNPDSQNAAAAAAVRGRFRLALTGTPLENSVRDLWSLGQFAAPGYLGTAADFEQRYAKPLETSGEPDVRRRLRRKIHPLILRRTKAEVLPELPPKVSFSAWCEMAEDQREIYQRCQRVGWQEIETLEARGPSGPRKMAMLTLLLRLRQACCDTRLLPGMEDRPISSAKVEMLRELLAEAVDTGHRTLVFSQFASMLRLLRDEAARWDLKSCYLDGQTKDREAEVRRFKQDREFQVFFISLKAGGSGLNLAEADQVIHFDPWWNPAVEDQATDRVHRIGQTKAVLSRRLVVAGTVEEKVVQLQQRKREWAQEFLESDDTASGAGGGSGLTEDELVTLIKPG
ncbi:MAG: DEAD/DEAH box helicase [Chthoniobacterales bacterium]